MKCSENRGKNRSKSSAKLCYDSLTIYATRASRKIDPEIHGRVKLENETSDFRVYLAENERLSGRIAWIDLMIVERDRTTRWVIEIGIRRHLVGMSLGEVSKRLDEYGSDPSHVAIHNWAHKANLQPIMTISENYSWLTKR